MKYINVYFTTIKKIMKWYLNILLSLKNIFDKKGFYHSIKSILKTLHHFYHSIFNISNFCTYALFQCEY